MSARHSSSFQRFVERVPQRFAVRGERVRRVAFRHRRAHVDDRLRRQVKFRQREIERLRRIVRRDRRVELIDPVVQDLQRDAALFGAPGRHPHVDGRAWHVRHRDLRPPRERGAARFRCHLRHRVAILAVRVLPPDREGARQAGRGGREIFCELLGRVEQRPGLQVRPNARAGRRARRDGGRVNLHAGRRRQFRRRGGERQSLLEGDRPELLRGDDGLEVDALAAQEETRLRDPEAAGGLRVGALAALEQIREDRLDLLARHPGAVIGHLDGRIVRAVVERERHLAGISQATRRVERVLQEFLWGDLFDVLAIER
jgi:hypothetical protein